MTTEQRFLAIAAVPDCIWLKYGLSISPSGGWIWFDKGVSFHLNVAAIWGISILPNRVEFLFSKGHLEIPFKSGKIECYFYS